jgi:hypothetical protein
MLRSLYRAISFLNRDFSPMPVGPDGRVIERGQRKTISLATSDGWFVLAPETARLHPKFEAIVMGAARRRPDVRLFYSDEAIYTATVSQPRLLIKPSFNIGLLMAEDYVGLPLIIHASAFSKLNGLRVAAGCAATYDLLLRAVSAGIGIGHIPEALIASDGCTPRADGPDHKAALQTWLASLDHQLRIAPGASCRERSRASGRLERHPPVTLVIAEPHVTGSDVGSGYEKPAVRTLLDNLARSDWPMDRLNVLVGCNDVSEGISTSGSWPCQVRYVNSCFGVPRNYAAQINAMWEAVETEYVVFINSSLSLRPSRWLDVLLSFAAEEDVGGAVARPLYGITTLNDTRMGACASRRCTCIHAGDRTGISACGDSDPVACTCSMASDFAFATRRSLLQLVNGFDKISSFRFDEDIGSCLRLRVLGYRIVYALLPGSCLARISHAVSAPP